MKKQTTHSDRNPRQAGEPLDPTKGAEQTEAEFRVSQDRPGHGIHLNPEDFAVEGPPGIERSGRQGESVGGIQTGPDTSNAKLPHAMPQAPTTPNLESDDRIEHSWRPGEKDPETRKH